MTLAPGTRLAACEILAPIGAGGMGEVYRARDTKLGREVAIKVLPAGATTDEERRQRFEREARATSALSYPNVATIFSRRLQATDGANHQVPVHWDLRDYVLYGVFAGRAQIPVREDLAEYWLCIYRRENRKGEWPWIGLSS